MRRLDADIVADYSAKFTTYLTLTRKLGALYLDGAVSARPRDCRCGLTCGVASPRNRASTHLADAGDYAS